MTLTQAEAFARIRLLRSPRIGPVSYAQLLARYGDAETALEALPTIGKRGGGSYSAVPRDRVEREVEAVRRAGAKYLFHDRPDYPALLREIEGAPPILTFRGDLTLASAPCVAVVGARNASAAAVKLAREFGKGLAEAGFTVVSGLARGIDGAAHEGAFPRTIGVIASGIDIAYPPQHEALQERIASEGLLLAEHPPGTEPRGSHFPSRNRIIAGLARGVVVVEAAPRSGSLITARLAGEQGREVFAVPGSPLDPRSRGTNGLIRDGAILVQSAEDIIEALAETPPQALGDRSGPEFDAPGMAAVGESELATARPTVLKLLGPSPVPIDELMRQSRLTPALLLTILLELELAGRLERHAGSQVSLIESV